MKPNRTRQKYVGLLQRFWQRSFSLTQEEENKTMFNFLNKPNTVCSLPGDFFGLEVLPKSYTG